MELLVGFFVSKIGRALVVIVGVTGIIFYVYSLGADAAKAECKVADMQGQIDTLKRDLKISHEAEETARQLTSRIDNQSKVLEQKVVNYEAALSKIPNRNICALNSDDIKWLRDIK